MYEAHNYCFLWLPLLWRSSSFSSFIINSKQMTPSNLAVIFGPILLRPEVESLDSMVQSTALNSIALYLIENFEEVFPVRFPAQVLVTSLGLLCCISATLRKY